MYCSHVTRAGCGLCQDKPSFGFPHEKTNVKSGKKGKFTTSILFNSAALQQSVVLFDDGISSQRLKL